MSSHTTFHMEHHTRGQGDMEHHTRGQRSSQAMTESARTLPGGGVIDDRRSEDEKAQTRCFAVGTDSFMSGWGHAPGKSYFALPCKDWREAQTCAENLRRRGDMKRVRVVGADWRPKLRDGDHLSIRNRDESSRHYTKGGF